MLGLCIRIPTVEDQPKNKKILKTDETHPLLCPGLLGSPVVQVLPHPSLLPPPSSSSLIPPREISPDCALTPSCHTTCKPLMKATPHQPLLWLPFVCGSNKQYSNQKPQNTPSPPPAPTPNHGLKPDAIPRGQLSGRLLRTPPTLLTYPCFFPPSIPWFFLPPALPV